MAYFTKPEEYNPLFDKDVDVSALEKTFSDAQEDGDDLVRQLQESFDKHPEEQHQSPSSVAASEKTPAEDDVDSLFGDSESFRDETYHSAPSSTAADDEDKSSLWGESEDHTSPGEVKTSPRLALPSLALPPKPTCLNGHLKSLFARPNPQSRAAPQTPPANRSPAQPPAPATPAAPPAAQSPGSPPKKARKRAAAHTPSQTQVPLPPAQPPRSVCTRTPEEIAASNQVLGKRRKAPSLAERFAATSAKLTAPLPASPNGPANGAVSGEQDRSHPTAIAPAEPSTPPPAERPAKRRRRDEDPSELVDLTTDDRENPIRLTTPAPPAVLPVANAQAMVPQAPVAPRSNLYASLPNVPYAHTDALLAMQEQARRAVDPMGMLGLPEDMADRAKRAKKARRMAEWRAEQRRRQEGFARAH